MLRRRMFEFKVSECSMRHEDAYHKTRTRNTSDRSPTEINKSINTYCIGEVTIDHISVAEVILRIDVYLVVFKI